MQAIILAAGMGKRLGELTRSNTKCMVKVNGVTLIERLLRQLDRVAKTRGLNRIVIVVGYQGKKLRDFIATLGIKTPVLFVDNPDYDTTNNIYSLYLVKDRLTEDDTLLVESDLIFEDALINKLLDNPHPSLALVAKFESWMDGTVVTLDEDDNIRQFIPGKKFSYRHAEEYYKTVNIYKFGKEFSRNCYVPFLAAYCTAIGHNEYYEQVLRVITMLDKLEIKALKLSGESWYEIDDVQDLDIAESIFCEPGEKLRHLESRQGGLWRYPQVQDHAHFTHPYFPDYRLRSELAANLDRLLRAEPSGQRVNSLLAAKDFGLKQNMVCVGNGTSELIRAYLGTTQGRIGIVLPCFEEYANSIGKERMVPFMAAERQFTYTVDELMEFYRGKEISALLLATPDFLTELSHSKEDITRLCKWCSAQGISLLLDETHMDFSPCSTANSMLTNAALAELPCLSVIKSISGACGFSGLCLGMLATADTARLSSIRSTLPLRNINSTAEFFLQIFGKYDKAYTAACLSLREESARVKAALTGIPHLQPIGCGGAYILCRVQPPLTAATIAADFLDHYGILLKDGSAEQGLAGYGSFLGIAVGEPSANDRVLQLLQDYLSR